MDRESGKKGRGVVLVLTRRIKPGCEDDYAAWLKRVTEAERQADGFVAREEYPPIDGYQEGWTSLVRFETDQQLDAWMSSSTLRALASEVEPLCSDVTRSRIQSGFEGWFIPAGEDSAGHKAPPSWKMTMAVVLALYPSIFLISWLFTSRVDWAFPVKLLVSNIIAVSCVSWISMPLVRYLLGRWMGPTNAVSLIANIAGAIAVAIALLVMLWIFMQIPMG